MFLRFRILLVVSLLCVVALSCTTIDDRPDVVIDGSFGDWETTDAATSDPKDSPNGFIDFGAVKVRHDRDAVYLLVDVGRVVTAQRLPGTVSLLLDVDGDPETGHMEYDMAGVDVVIEFPLPNERNPGTPGAGIRLRALDENGETSQTISAYSVGFILAPVHAASTFETRIDRRGPIGPTPPLFQGEEFRGRFVAVDLQGEFVDSTEMFRYKLTRTPRSTQRTDASIDPLRRLQNTDFRMLFWNMDRGSYIKNPAPFSRILSAVRPDIIVLDEIPPTTNSAEVEQFLYDSFLMDSWSVSFGEGGNDQRVVVASRHPVETAEPFQRVLYSDEAVATLTSMGPNPDDEYRVREWLKDSVPTLGAIVTMGEQSLLAVGLDMQCCGGYETIQDQRRIIEAEAINKAVRDTIASKAIDGVVVGGDFNLVGDPAVISIAGRNADPNGGSLTRVRALQIDGLSDATWENPDEPFTPGRLDNVIHSSSLAVKRAFVFDSTDVSGRWQSYYGFRSTDSPEASDHLPVVVDFQWIDGTGTKRR